jgi:hypothetical protein
MVSVNRQPAVADYSRKVGFSTVIHYFATSLAPESLRISLSEIATSRGLKWTSVNGTPLHASYPERHRFFHNAPSQASKGTRLPKSKSSMLLLKIAIAQTRFSQMALSLLVMGVVVTYASQQNSGRRNSTNRVALTWLPFPFRWEESNDFAGPDQCGVL